MGTSSGTKKRRGRRRPEPAFLPAILDGLLPFAGIGKQGPAWVIRHWLKFLEMRYTETRNPVYVWEAMARALHAGRQLPPWITAYLTRVSDRVREMSRTSLPQHDIPPIWYRASEFDVVKGQNPFRIVTETSHDQEIAFQVWTRLRQGYKPDFAYHEVASVHPAQCDHQPPCKTISRTTVSRIWQQYKRTPPFDLLPTR